MSIMNFDDLQEIVNGEVKNYLDTMELTTANRLGLDPRAGHEIFVGSNEVAVFIKDERALKYYGGFEYINDDDRTQLGDYVFYSKRATRVAECLEFYNEEEQYNG